MTEPLDHPLFQELKSLKTAVARFQEEAHTNALKLQHHALESTRLIQLERANQQLQAELDVLRAHPHPDDYSSQSGSTSKAWGTSAHPAAAHARELTLSLRNLSQKLTETENALQQRNLELVQSQAEVVQAKLAAETAYGVGARVRGREETSNQRVRDLEWEVKQLNEEKKAVEMALGEYADLVRDLEGRGRQSSSSQSTSGGREKAQEADKVLLEHKLDLENVVSGFKQDIVSLESQLEHEKAQLETFQAQYEALQRTNVQLHSELARTRTELDRLKAEDNTAAKMVSRYMQFSQKSTNALQTSVQTLTTRHSATLNTLTSQSHTLTSQLRLAESTSARLRQALDELGGEMMRETLGRRREVALRMRAVSREEKMREALSRWVRKGEEAWIRVRDADALHEDPQKVKEAYLDMMQESKTLLARLDDGVWTETNIVSGSLGRLLVVEGLLDGLLGELNGETVKKVEFERRWLEAADEYQRPVHHSLPALPLPSPEVKGEHLGNGHAVPEKGDVVEAEVMGAAPPAVPRKLVVEIPPIEVLIEPASADTLKNAVDVVVPHPIKQTSLPPLPKEDAPLQADSVQEDYPAPPAVLVTLEDASELDVAVIVDQPSPESTLPRVDPAQENYPAPPTVLVTSEDASELDVVVTVDQPSPESTLPQVNSTQEDYPAPPTVLVTSEDASELDVVVTVNKILPESPIFEESSVPSATQDESLPDIPSSENAPEKDKFAQASPIINSVLDVVQEEIYSPSPQPHSLPQSSGSPTPPPSEIPFIPEPPAVNILPLFDTFSIPLQQDPSPITPPKPHPLLHPLQNTENRYADLQRSFRDCHAALESLREGVNELNPNPSLSTVSISKDILEAILQRLDDYIEDVRVELEIKVEDESMTKKGWEMVLSLGKPEFNISNLGSGPSSVPGHLIDDDDEGGNEGLDDMRQLEREIETYIECSDFGFKKARGGFERKLVDVEHDVSVLKRWVYEGEFMDGDVSLQPEPSTLPISPTPQSMQRSISEASGVVPSSGGGSGWTSWIRSPSSASISRPSTPRPVSPSQAVNRGGGKTFGDIMTTPRVPRHPQNPQQQQQQTQQTPATPASTTRRGSFANLFLGGGSPSNFAQRRDKQDPVQLLGLKVPMPHFSNTSTTVASPSAMSATFGSIGSFGMGALGLGSPLSPGGAGGSAGQARSRTLSGVYMLGLGGGVASPPGSAKALVGNGNGNARSFSASGALGRTMRAGDQPATPSKLAAKEEVVDMETETETEEDEDEDDIE